MLLVCARRAVDSTREKCGGSRLAATALLTQLLGCCTDKKVTMLLLIPSYRRWYPGPARTQSSPDGWRDGHLPWHCRPDARARWEGAHYGEKERRSRLVQKGCRGGRLTTGLRSGYREVSLPYLFASRWLFYTLSYLFFLLSATTRTRVKRRRKRSKRNKKRKRRARINPSKPSDGSSVR